MSARISTQWYSMGFNLKLKSFISEIMLIELLLILYMRGKQSVMISPYISILNLNNWKHLKGENFNLYIFTIPIRKSAKTAFWCVLCGSEFIFNWYKSLLFLF